MENSLIKDGWSSDVRSESVKVGTIFVCGSNITSFLQVIAKTSKFTVIVRQIEKDIVPGSKPDRDSNVDCLVEGVNEIPIPDRYIGDPIKKVCRFGPRLGMPQQASPYLSFPPTSPFDFCRLWDGNPVSPWTLKDMR